MWFYLNFNNIISKNLVSQTIIFLFVIGNNLSSLGLEPRSYHKLSLSFYLLSKILTTVFQKEWWQKGSSPTVFYSVWRKNLIVLFTSEVTDFKYSGNIEYIWVNARTKSDQMELFFSFTWSLKTKLKD